MTYKGKYKKCRQCKHAEEVMTELVIVKESCPKKWRNSFGRFFSDKHKCQECEHFEKGDAI